MMPQLLCGTCASFLPICIKTNSSEQNKVYNWIEDLLGLNVSVFIALPRFPPKWTRTIVCVCVRGTCLLHVHVKGQWPVLPALPNAPASRMES